MSKDRDCLDSIEHLTSLSYISLVKGIPKGNAGWVSWCLGLRKFQESSSWLNIPKWHHLGDWPWFTGPLQVVSSPKISLIQSKHRRLLNKTTMRFYVRKRIVWHARNSFKHGRLILYLQAGLAGNVINVIHKCHYNQTVARRYMIIMLNGITVSYTHLTLPTIYSV